MTLYVATRWYRAPEVILSWKEYGKAIDLWSAGCVIAELLSRRPLFPGKNYLHQVDVICALTGTPTEEELSNIPNEQAANYVRKLGVRPRVPLRKVFPKAPAMLVDLLSRLLVFDPLKRLTAKQSLDHPFLANAPWRSACKEDGHEDVATTIFNFDFESDLPSADGYRQLIAQEIDRVQKGDFQDDPDDGEQKQMQMGE